MTNIKHIGLILFAILSLLLIIISDYTILHVADTEPWPGHSGQNIKRIPIAWCAVIGSNAAPLPGQQQVGIPIEPRSSNLDRDTDSILWRRHERATDNIFIKEAGITFRSSLLATWGTGIHFPQINDPDPRPGAPGDVALGDQVQRIGALCKAEWRDLTRRHNIPGAPAGTVPGIPAVNVRQIVNPDGSPSSRLGSSGCTGDPDGNCRDDRTRIPYNGAILVIDNYYTFPGINSGRMGLNNDPWDQLFAHEAGHALALNCRLPNYYCNSNDDRNPNYNHNQDLNSLMYWQQRANPPNGPINNRGLSPEEVNRARYTAGPAPTAIPGVQEDPPGKIINGNILTSYAVDESEDIQNHTEPLDLSVLQVSLDTAANRLYLGQEIFAKVISEKEGGLQYWNFIDTDNNNATGANHNLLSQIGSPLTNITGVDLVTKAEINEGRGINGTVWWLDMNTNTALPLPQNSFQFELITINLIPYYESGTKETEIETHVVPLHDIIAVRMDSNLANISLNKQFNVQSITAREGIRTTTTTTPPLSDKLEESFILDYPSFAQCFPQNLDARAGETTKIDVMGLPPNSNIHGLLGPIPVINGTTDSKGNATIDFPIPNDTTAGPHLVTIGKDGTAITADCEINILIDRDAGQEPINRELLLEDTNITALTNSSTIIQ